MARKEIIIASVITVAGLAGGYWLLPEDSDVAQMEVRDYNYNDPEQHFEARFNEGDHSLDVVQQLVRIHTNTGNVDRAIEVLEVYVKEHPQDSEALRQLGTLYQHAQRYQEYLDILEARAEGSEDPVVLAELSQLYNFFQMEDKQKSTLQRLYAAEKGTNAQTIRDLAAFKTVDKEFAEVAALMEALHNQHAEAYAYEDAVMHVNALLETGKPDQAVEMVQFWQASPNSQPQEIAFLIDMLHYQASSAHAHAVLDAMPQEEVYGSADLLHSYILLMLADGKRDEAYEILSTLYEQDRLPDELVADLMYMAAVNGNAERFEALRRKTGLSRLPQSQLADIWTVARRSGNRNVMRAIEQHVAQAGDEEYPLLETLILIGKKSPARHAAVRDLLETSLDNEALLKLAEASAEAGDRSDARLALAKLPEYDKLTLNELASLELVYLHLRDKDMAQQYVSYVQNSGRVDASSDIGLRTAAAYGDAATLNRWYAAYGDSADAELLSDLFYQASNHGQLQLALEIADWQKDPRQKALARRNVADIYTRLGRYEAALGLLEQESPRNEADVRDRAFLLSKLAPRSPHYRTRLQGLVQQWHKPSTSRRTKEDLTYTLIGIGDEEAALPYMKNMADQYGGEWTLAYADALVQHGRADDAVPYYLQAAKDPNLDAPTRMGIAYALADRGQRDAAQTLLIALTEEPETRQAAAAQLAYLWGPRPRQEQLEWLVNRWRMSEGAEKEAYAKLLADSIPPDMLEQQIRQTPELRRIPQLDSNYIHGLAQQHRLRPEIEAVANYAQQSGDTAYLQYLANTARDYGSYKDARYGYDRVLAVAPEHQPALIGATLTAAAQADYPAISDYFRRYEAQAAQPPVMVTADTHEAYFAYAENLRREGKPEAARPYYAQAVQFVEANRLYDAESLSVAAQSSAWLGDVEKSDKIFNYAYTRHPESGILRADRTALLIEQRRYDAAQDSLGDIRLASTVEQPKSLTVAMLTSGDTGLATPPQILADGQQMLVPTLPEGTMPRPWVNSLRQDAGVSYITEGYDSVLLVSKVGYRFTLTEPREGDWMANVVADADYAPRSEQAQLALRKELLAARLDLETGKLESAADRMEALEGTYSEDPQYLGFAANTYYYATMWPTAKSLIEQAAVQSPDNADITRLQNSIERYHPDHVRGDVTWINRGDNEEIRTSLSGETQVADRLRMGGIVRNHAVETDNELQPNGTIGGRSDDRQTMEIYGIYSPTADSMIKAQLFGNNDTLGAGVDYSFVNPLGVTTVGGRYHEPYMEFIEGIMDSAVRDRVAVSHVIKPRTNWQLSGGLSYNQYHIDSADDVMSTVGVDLGVNYTVQQAQPYIGIGYGLLAEYELDNEFQQTTGGQFYRQLPLRSREIHFGSVTLAHDFSEKTYGSLLLGYGWDRLGGHGPAAEGSINHEFYDNWDIGARAFYGMNTTNTDDSFNMMNGYVRYRF